ncbi:Crp/Fnr family transcriptional regulator [Dysgonomonas sp. 511]|uniref:Crp/Fnr family transcriptional regulator n=1 Tax=Dysgonomonas sp. 511 TaxID=2302930 RepID=UPI0013D72C7B|nr:Crp/Fnr family transcriptional regulator [Dysgonomonas sp. 511]NDV79880.1 Crp/Fnr family transcriptional regulator [Dysgonomonas sp. 511]
MEKQVFLSEQQINIIHKIPLFRGTTDEFKETLLDRLDYSVRDICKGEIIIRQGTPCQHMHILLKGNLEVNIVDASGNNVKVENLVGPRAFATPHLFDEHGLFPATFTVVEDGVLFKATKESAFALISSNPELLKNFLRITGNCTACTVGRLKILSYKSIRSRFAYYLFERRKGSDEIEMEHNQTQLAEYLNVTRPALANEIKRMSDEGLIRVDGRKAEIIAHASLLQYI